MTRTARLAALAIAALTLTACVATQSGAAVAPMAFVAVTAERGGRFT